MNMFLAASLTGATEILWKGIVAMLVVTAALMVVMYIFKYTDKKIFNYKQKKAEQSDGKENVDKIPFFDKIKKLKK